MLKVSARIFPIGYIISVDAPNFDPNDFYLDGNWVRIKGRVIVGVDENQTEFNETGKLGGEKTHTLTIDEMPKFRPSAITNSTVGGDWSTLAMGTAGGTAKNNPFSEIGGGLPHNNLQPYYVAYIWKLVSYNN